MSIKLLKSMISHPSGKSFFQRFGSTLPSRRSRHIKSQMKFFGGPKYRRNSQSSFLGSGGGRIKYL